MNTQSPRNTAFRRTSAGWLLTYLGFAACVGDPEGEAASAGDERAPTEDEIGEAQQAVCGAVSTRSCDAQQQSYLRNVMVLGRSIVQSQAFGECLDRAIREGVPSSWGYTSIGPYDPCDDGITFSGDAYNESSLATKVAKARAATLSWARPSRSPAARGTRHFGASTTPSTRPWQMAR